MQPKEGKKAIEDVYEIILSNKGPYHLQLSYLDQSGEIGNTKKLAVVLFKLCEIVDTQQEEIAALRKALLSSSHKASDTNYETNSSQAGRNPDANL